MLIESATRRRATAALALTLTLFGGAAPLCARDWTWVLPAERYKTLNVFERAQYDKAAQLLKQNSYKSAASEFEKFKVQFTDSPVISYILFMRGYCLHQSKHRNQAVKIYNEVLDYFSEEIADAAPALYFMGVAHIENGDTREGMTCMKDMATDEEYQKHPLAAGALARLAENHWRNKEPEQAVAYWKQVVRDFHKVSHTEANRARSNVTIYYIKKKDYAAYEAWLVTDENRDDAASRCAVATNAMDRAHHSVFPDHLRQYSRFEQKERDAAAKACFDYFKARRPWFAKAERLWDYQSRAVQFLCRYHRDKKERHAIVDEIVAGIKKETDKKKRDGAYAWLIDRLREGRDYDRARYCIALMSEAPHAAYKEAEIHFDQHQWTQALAKLVQIGQMGDAGWAGRALERRAWIHKDYLYKYEEAVKLYRELNRPPWSLWQIQECYIRWGKLKEAITSLSEIENSFPDDAPKAAWYKASYYHEAKQGKMAVAQARKILKAYKESPEASQAHQLLEKYGVATGGGVFHEE